MKLFEELLWRGLIKQVTSEQVESLLNGDPVTFYCGFDPTSDSLHVGSLLPLITMKRLQNKGHNPIFLGGVCTSMIGDPSFKSTERKLLSEQEVSKNMDSIKKGISNIIQCEMVENSWFNQMSVIEFLRTVGKSFTVNNMLTKDSVRSRLEDREQGISFTEFSYSLLQAQDFKVLFEQKKCILQLGGSDQFGNIVSGINLVRKELGKEVFGLTLPLLIKSDGTKFGKSEQGNVWLNADKTPPFDFFQFFVRTEDADVVNLLKMLTFLSKEEIDSLESSIKTEPHLRKAQKALAQELTRMVHGEEILQDVLNKTSALFTKKDNSVIDLEMTKESLLNKKVVDLLAELQMSSSKTMARKDIEGHAISINDEKIKDISLTLQESHLKDKLVIQKGKKLIKVIKIV